MEDTDNALMMNQKSLDMMRDIIHTSYAESTAGLRVIIDKYMPDRTVVLINKNGSPVKQFKI